MSKLVKKMQLDALTKNFDGVRNLIVIAPTKVNAATDYNFRKMLRDKNISLTMVKNTLARKVLAEQGINLPADTFTGTTLVAWGAESVKDLAKGVESAFAELKKKNAKIADFLKVKLAVADGAQVTFEAAQKMPTRLEAVGEIVSMMMGPASQLAGCLQGPGGELASQIASIADKVPEEAPAAEDAPAA